MYLILCLAIGRGGHPYDYAVRVQTNVNKTHYSLAQYIGAAAEEFCSPQLCFKAEQLSSSPHLFDTSEQKVWDSHEKEGKRNWRDTEAKEPEEISPFDTRMISFVMLLAACQWVDFNE